MSSRSVSRFLFSRVAAASVARYGSSAGSSSSSGFYHSMEQRSAETLLRLLQILEDENTPSLLRNHQSKKKPEGECLELVTT
jgi:hypothetical protein